LVSTKEADILCVYHGICALFVLSTPVRATGFFLRTKAKLQEFFSLKIATVLPDATGTAAGKGGFS